jgi:ASC-1-like (ASCH) protein
MIHQMGLYERPFCSIKSGKKTVEVRLYDEKRRGIQVGDIIEFVKVPDEKETVKVKVIALHPYETFADMYRDIPFSLFDCEGWTMEEMLKATYAIYTKEQERQ